MSQPRTRPSGRGPGRTTWQRTAVRAALEGNDGFVSAQELHHQMRSAGDAVGLTTVYRQLHLLAEQGDADVVPTPEGALYRLCRTDEHHHHLICRGCGRTVEVDGPDLEHWADEVGEAHGFSDLDHVIEFFGTCRACTDASCGDPA